MRDLILKMSISLDGFISAADGDNSWMFGGDQAARTWSAEYLWQGGLHAMGGATFAAMARHWPTATDPFAAPMNAIPKAVFTRQPAEPASASAGSWAAPHVASGDIAAAVARLKAMAGKPIIAHGGVDVARSLVAEGLVDQFVLMVIPVALGRGEPLFADLPAPLRLTLVESTRFPGGAVATVYRTG